jgi:membrane-associated protease RseP (regulator of RpoE activity)
MASPGWSCPCPEEVRVSRNVAIAGEAPKAVIPAVPAVPPDPSKKTLTIKRIEAIGEEGKERTWLGVGLDEPDEALCAQLGLKDGAGLLVTYVAGDSPAEKAGLQKNDVLLEMEGQTLLVPAQLQKLVQARKEGDQVTLKFLRGGKEDSVNATLGKTKTRVMTADGDNALIWKSAPGAYSYTLTPGAHADHMIILEKALKEAKIDQERVKVEVQRSMEEARKAMEEALRTTRKADGSLKEVHKELEALAKAQVFMPNDAMVVVRSSGKSSKSMVQADESGTIVLVKNPKLRLTAHDKDGNMLFDGEVETKEQREQVPADLWKKVEPLVEKFSSGVDE